VIYFVRAGVKGPIKIGRTDQLSQRVQGLQVAHYEELTLLAVEPGSRAVERALHQRFDHLRLRGEWFRPGMELLAYIESLRAAQAV
jgi:hypothetical protein